MELGGTNIVLGVNWLVTLGKIKANFWKLVFRWKKDGAPREIRGHHSLCRAESSWKSTLKALKDDGSYLIAPNGDKTRINVRLRGIGGSQLLIDKI